jgi:hypothetical protein
MGLILALAAAVGALFGVSVRDWLNPDSPFYA